MAARTKFNVNKDVSKRTYNGITFDSVLEMKYYRDVLCPLVESGDVVNYELQKPYELQPKFIHDGKSVQPIKYVADFFIVHKDGHEEVIDTKGCPDSVAILKENYFGITILLLIISGLHGLKSLEVGLNMKNTNDSNEKKRKTKGKLKYAV